MEKKSFTFEEIKQKLVNFCVYQDRCHLEVENKMRDFLLIPEAKEELYLYLIQENYLNEERFVRSCIRGKFYMKKWGKTKIKLHLKQKGISDKLIQVGMDEIHEDDYQSILQQLYDAYYQKLAAPNDYQKKMKTIRHLLSKGYEYEEISKIAD